jgi:predicted Ser/Thr protein kinase
MESGSAATLGEVFEHWAEGNKARSDVISRVVPKELLTERLDLASNNGETTGALELLLEGQNLSVVDKSLCLSFIAACREWSKGSFRRPKRRYDAYAAMRSPSSIANDWSEMQGKGKQQVFYCARPAERAWINVRIMHEVFNEVVQAFMSGDPESKDYGLAYKLCLAMAGSFSKEGSRRDEILRLLNPALFSPLGFSVAVSHVPDTDCDTDGSSFEHGISFEFKNEKGVGGGDPYMQNVAYFMHTTVRAPENLKKHCCPWLLIEVVGPEMGISGAVWAFDKPCDRPCAQPLTPNVPFLPVTADTDMLLLQARLCMALRIGCAGLKRFYDFAKFLPPSSQALFPYPRRAKFAGAEAEFEYTECLGGSDARKMVFLAKRSDNGDTIIVKFTDSYSEEVHRALATQGLAPTLHDFQNISGLYMVVMDFVNGACMWDNDKHQSKSALRAELERVLRVLEHNNYVHGDLRAPNILVKDNDTKISIVDFDWAGLER